MRWLDTFDYWDWCLISLGSFDLIVDHGFIINNKMDKNVERLLQEEKQVNAQVQKALAEKNDLLKTIKNEAEISVREYRRQLEKD